MEHFTNKPIVVGLTKVEAEIVRQALEAKVEFHWQHRSRFIARKTERLLNDLNSAIFHSRVV